MAFPFNYTKNIFPVFTRNSPEQVLPKILTDFNVKQTDLDFKTESIIKFTNNNSLLKFDYQLKISIIHNQNNFIKYEFETTGILKIIFIIELILLFTFRYNLNTFFIISSIFIPIFYSVNILYINAKIQNQIQKTLENLRIKYFFTKEEQTDYIENDENHCIACKAEINPYEVICENCGTKQEETEPVNQTHATNYHGFKIKYHLRKRKKSL